MRSLVYPFAISIVFVVLTFIAFRQLEGYFSEQLNALVQNPLQFSVVSFLILAADIVLPVPSSIVMFVNGYTLGAAMGAGVSLLGLQTGAMLGYYLGYAGSGRFSKDKNQEAQSILLKYGPLAILLSRGIPILSESICIVCGYNKMPFKKYFFLNLLGYAPICLLYAVCGSLGHDGHTFMLAFGASIFISLGFWVFGRQVIFE